jgi:hypothetical protein
VYQDVYQGDYNSVIKLDRMIFDVTNDFPLYVTFSSRINCLHLGFKVSVFVVNISVDVMFEVVRKKLWREMPMVLYTQDHEKRNEEFFF